MDNTTAAAAGGGFLILGLFLLALGLALYFVPSIIAFARHHRQAVAIFALNLLLGWSVLGWIAALIWSVTNSQQQVVYVQTPTGTAVVNNRPETPA